MRKFFLGLLLVLLLAPPAGAEVFYYIDENGQYHFTDSPETANRYSRLSMWEDGGGDPEVIYLSPSYSSIIDEACRYYKVDTNLIKAMIKVESNFNRNAVSRAGAQGLMQLMPATSRRFKVNDPFHPVENIWAGVYYVKWLMVKFNYKYDLVLAAYNAGENAVTRYGGIPPYRETQAYVRKVKYYWSLYQKKSPRFEAER